MEINGCQIHEGYTTAFTSLEVALEFKDSCRMNSFSRIWLHCVHEIWGFATFHIALEGEEEKKKRDGNCKWVTLMEYSVWDKITW